MKRIDYVLLILIFCLGCTRNPRITDSHQSIDPELIENAQSFDEISYEINNNPEIIISWDNYDWLTEFDWSLSDGRYYVNPLAENVYWMGNMSPKVNIYKLNIPQDSDLYQIRLRNEHFYFMYQTDGKNKLYPLDNTFYKNILEITYANNYSRITLMLDGYVYSNQNRVGEQNNVDYPLVGLWGNLPHLTEYRAINPSECFYYLEIDKKIPDFAIRSGTYLLKQTGAKQFETISSFPDGQLRLEFIDDQSMLITPLFTLPDEEEGIIGELIMSYNPNYPRFSTEED